MDTRCPRKLKQLPDNWCPLAVLRLKAIRSAGKELTEEEEAKLSGCPWHINNQLANYCFFVYASKFMSEQQLSDVEMASMLNLSIDTIKRAEKVALNKARAHPEFVEIKKTYGKDPIMDDNRPSPDDL